MVPQVEAAHGNRLVMGDAGTGGWMNNAVALELLKGWRKEFTFRKVATRHWILPQHARALAELLGRRSDRDQGGD